MPRPQDVLRESLAELARPDVAGEVDLVHEVRELELVFLGIVQRHVEVFGGHQLADDLVNRAQQLQEVVRSMRRMGNAVHRFLHAFGAAPSRHVTETPHATDRAALQPQRYGVALEHPAVFEVQHVEAVGLGLGVAFLNPVHEVLRIQQLILDMLDQPAAAGGVVIGGNQRGRQAPHFLEAPVVRHDIPIEIYDQNAVRRRFEGGLENGDREGVSHPTGFLRPVLGLAGLRPS